MSISVVNVYSFIEEDPWVEMLKSIILIQEDVAKLKGRRIY